MFEFIKNWFSKKEELTFEDLPEWLDNNIKLAMDSKAEIDTQFQDRINRVCQRIKEKTDILRNATYTKPVEPKVISIVNQNRITFIKQVEQAIDNISFEPEKKINNLLQNSNKLINTLKHLYFDEIDSILKEIKTTALYIDEHKKAIKATKLEYYEKVKHQLNLYNETIQKQKELEQKIEDNTKEKEQKEKTQTELQTKINEIEHTNQAKEYHSKCKERDMLTKRIKGMRDEMLSQFSVIERALKKYGKIALNQIIIDDYLKDPINTLLKDNTMKILDILKGIEKNISKLDLKDKKEEKTLEMVHKMHTDGFYKFIKDIQEDMLKLKVIMEEIDDNKFLSNKDRLISNLEFVNNEITNIKKELDNNNKLLGQINPDEIKNSIKLKNVKIC